MTSLLKATLSMEAVITTPRKRNHEGELITNTPNTAPSLSNSNSNNTPSRQPSPAPSDTGSELTEFTSNGIQSPARSKSGPAISSDTLDDGSATAKKRKLTFAEKEVEKAVRQKEKEERAKQKAEEKARREDEKRQKDEEKRKKEEEKEAGKRAKELERAEKQKARDAEKQEKDAEKARKEADKKVKELEKLKKERSQMKIGTFFGRPAPQSTPPTTPDDPSSRASSRRSSIAAIDIADPVLDIPDTKLANPDFEKYIIPFFVHEHTEIAPVNRFSSARKGTIFGGNQSDYTIGTVKIDVEPLRCRFGPSKKRIRVTESVREIAERVQATQINTVDLIGDYNPLIRVPYKFLSFREDIRPPYTGTYSKRIASNVARKMSRKPTYKGRTDTNYDYDSEAEWEEPAADDEEILDDEMSESEDGEEDMQDFLDDEDDQGKRRMFALEMEPVSSGLCFQGENYDSNGYKMEDYRMDVLHESTKFPIDPYSTDHWSDIGKHIPSKAKIESTTTENHLQPEPTNKSMPPPRIPLAPLNQPNNLSNFLAPGNTVHVSQNENSPNQAKQRARQPNTNKEVKLIPAELMDDFKQAINGSDLTKAGLIEILKKRFPKCSKDAIKDTVGMVAVRVGKKESDKKWELV